MQREQREQLRSEPEDAQQLKQDEQQTPLCDDEAAGVARAEVLTSPDLLSEVLSVLVATESPRLPPWCASIVSIGDELKVKLGRGFRTERGTEVVPSLENLRANARQLVKLRRMLLSAALTCRAFHCVATLLLQENAQEIARIRRHVRKEDERTRQIFAQYAELT